MNLSQVSTSDPMSFGNLKLVECTIHVLQQGTRYPIVLSERSDYANRMDSTLWDWMMKGDPAQNYEESRRVFRLHLHSQTANRLKYRINGISDRDGRRLATSNKGYLGMYIAADAPNYFKLEPLEWDGQQLRCRWRDHLGHTVQVGEYPTDPSYRDQKGGLIEHLNVHAEGDCEYLVTPIR